MFEYSCTIVKVIDGDTVDVDIDLGFGVWLKKQRIRLYGIDTPESRTRDTEEKVFGLEAKAYLKTRLENCEKLIVKTEKDGKYGRMLGWFYSHEGETSINIEMVEKGYAWEYDGGKKEKNLQDLLEVRGVPV